MILEIIAGIGFVSVLTSSFIVTMLLLLQDYGPSERGCYDENSTKTWTVRRKIGKQTVYMFPFGLWIELRSFDGLFLGIFFNNQIKRERERGR